MRNSGIPHRPRTIPGLKRSVQSGQAATEYLIVLLMAAIVLLAGGGEVMLMLLSALQRMYTQMFMAIALP